jgi:hypothetical protein
VFEGSIRCQAQKCFARPPTFGTKSWRPSKKNCLKLSWKHKLSSLKLSKVQKFPQINFFNVILDFYLTFFPSFLYFTKLCQNKESIYRGILTLSFSHYIFKLCILLSLSFNSLLQVLPSLEGVELIQKRLLEDNSKEVFSLFVTLQ